MAKLPAGIKRIICAACVDDQYFVIFWNVISALQKQGYLNLCQLKQNDVIPAFNIEQGANFSGNAFRSIHSQSHCLALHAGVNGPVYFGSLNFTCILAVLGTGLSSCDEGLQRGPSFASRIASSLQPKSTP